MRKTGVAVSLAMVIAGCQVSDGEPDQPPELVVEYGCGYGFYLGSVDQTAALLIEYTDYERAASGDVVETGSVGTDPWLGNLQWGSDLFANWCDDVLDPDEPTPRIEGTWAVTGTIEVTYIQDGSGCGLGSARAELVDLTATSLEGDEIDLGDFEVENDSWGCIAG